MKNEGKKEIIKIKYIIWRLPFLFLYFSLENKKNYNI